MTTLLNPPVRRVETVETTPPRLTHADFMRFAPEDAKAGVHELWLIDPYGSAGTQFFQCQQEGEDLIEVAPVDGIIHSVALPNFKLNTAWLWPDANNDLPNTVTVLKELGVF